MTSRKWLFSLLVVILVTLSAIPISITPAFATVYVTVVNGTITFQTFDKEKTSNIYYVTTGWIVHRNPRCNDTKTVCNPRSGAHGEIKNMPQVGGGREGGGIIRSDFVVPEADVNTALSDAGLSNIQENDIFYLSSVFHVYNHGVKKGPYYTLAEISAAEGWGDLSYFPQYYDIPVPYHAQYPVDVFFLDEGGNEFKPAATIGEYKPDTQVSYSFPEFATGDDGKRYKFVSSYHTTNNEPNKILGRADGLRERSVTVVSRGNNIFGVYTPATVTPPTRPPIPDGYMTPNPTAKIRADDRDRGEIFNVDHGIPTSEYLYANAFTENYLFQHQFRSISGVKPYPITLSKTFSLTWEEFTGFDSAGNEQWVSRSETTTVSHPYTVERAYLYWVIDSFQAYKIKQADLTNNALPNQQVTLLPNGYVPPSVFIEHSLEESVHLIDPDYEEEKHLGSASVNGGRAGRPPVESYDFSSEAEQAVGKIIVKNDLLRFDGQTIMSADETEEIGPTPTTVPAPDPARQLDKNILYRNHLQIESWKPNVSRTPSTGTMTYELYAEVGGGEQELTFPINGITPVTIHTPVVNFPQVTDDQAHNQKRVPNYSRSALILDRPFTVTMPTVGQHRDIDGYRYRDYQRYTRSRQVLFPFDTMSADRTRFFAKNQWIEIPAGQPSYTFFLPVWVDEGNYEVYTRAIPINSPAAGFGTERHANLNLQNYVATETLPVEVIGRIYDFRVTDVADYNWKYVFRADEQMTPTGAAYWVGQTGIDEAQRGNRAPYVLPIRPGSHPFPAYRNVAVKTGYQFKFDLKTKGNLFGPYDGVRIWPRFYHVDANGGRRQEVDLYMHTSDRLFVQVGASTLAPENKRYVILNDAYRNVPRQELTNTAWYHYNYSFTPQERARSTFESYATRFIENAQRKSWVGDYQMLLLTQGVRTFIGPTQVPAGVDVGRALAAEQKWYGEYSIPAAPYIVPRGTDLMQFRNGLDNRLPIFLRDGYLIVNFYIETIRNGQADAHLRYYDVPLRQQWWTESQPSPVGSLGDVVWYHAHLSSQDDFEPSGTH